jgi:hypothetical protein
MLRHRRIFLLFIALSLPSWLPVAHADRNFVRESNALGKVFEVEVDVDTPARQAFDKLNLALRKCVAHLDFFWWKPVPGLVLTPRTLYGTIRLPDANLLTAKPRTPFSKDFSVATQDSRGQMYGGDTIGSSSSVLVKRPPAGQHLKESMDPRFIFRPGSVLAVIRGDDKEKELDDRARLRAVLPAEGLLDISVTIARNLEKLARAGIDADCENLGFPVGKLAAARRTTTQDLERHFSFQAVSGVPDVMWTSFERPPPAGATMFERELSRFLGVTYDPFPSPYRPKPTPPR